MRVMFSMFLSIYCPFLVSKLIVVCLAADLFLNCTTDLPSLFQFCHVLRSFDSGLLFSLVNVKFTCVQLVGPVGRSGSTSTFTVTKK